MAEYNTKFVVALTIMVECFLTMLDPRTGIDMIPHILYDIKLAATMTRLISPYSNADWAQEGDDPCLPVPWTWVQCNVDPQPKMIKIVLSRKNLTGNIPIELTKLTSLVELWLNANSFVGSIPDFSGAIYLESIHPENKRLPRVVPSSLLNLQNLSQLSVQHNLLSGPVPCSLLTRGVGFSYSGNLRLHCSKGLSKNKKLIIGTVVGASALLLIALTCLCICHNQKRYFEEENLTDILLAHQLTSSFSDAGASAAHCFHLVELEDATERFERQIGYGGFGVVYYGRLFEFMHIGTLKEHLYGSSTRGSTISWIKRLEIADNAAKGVEYLHNGWVPIVIHRDIKSSNILFDKHMRAKVSDFGFSKVVVEGSCHVSRVVRGTGVILLELISGRQSNWKIVEKALMCVQPSGRQRPSISDVLKEIQEAVSIERGSQLGLAGTSDTLSRSSLHSPTDHNSQDFTACEPRTSFADPVAGMRHTIRD
ncbi:probable LRR receptor-like serine/threonine-protein kinase At1g67720 [Aristolochia californica]|uniref:probable LRR receptor-like serine/threonine-protein kinase At1g67720 n=1 Tax=Aristolochia californica TaxID=171875 RepID=UPI0035D582FF